MPIRHAWNKKGNLIALRLCASFATGALLWAFPPADGLSFWLLLPWLLYCATTVGYLAAPASWFVHPRFDYGFVGLELTLLGSIFAVYLGTDSWLFYGAFVLTVVLAALARRLVWAVLMSLVVGSLYLAAHFDSTTMHSGALLLQTAMLLITAGLVGYLSEELDQQEQATALLDNALQIAGLIAGALDPRTVYEKLTEVVAQLFRAGRVAVILTEPDSDVARVAMALDRGQPVDDVTIDLERYPEIQTALHREAPVIIGRLADNPRLDPLRSELPDRALEAAILVTPIMVGAEPRGVVFVRLEDARRGFTESEIKFCRIMADVAGQALQRAEHFEEVAEAARRDPLTGLYNVRVFHRRLTEEVERADRTHSHLSLVMLDIDYLKHVNDNYGHLAGDRLIREIAKMLLAEVRVIDTVTRYGGEEFALLLPDTGTDRAHRVAERLRTLVQEVRHEGLPTTVTVSIGLATYPDDAMTPSDLLHKADQALYASKNRGRNQTTRYEEIEEEEVATRKDQPLHDPVMIEAIRDALKGLESSRGLLRHLDVIASLTAVMGAKDPKALEQMRDVSTMAELILGHLPIGERQRWTIHIACLVRDVGKLAISDEILDKSDYLTRQEYEIVRRHPVISAQIIQPLKGYENVLPLVRHHHERWDGKGYPDGLQGEEIPYGARVVGLIDAFYAMVRRRPYANRERGLHYACEEIRRNAGTQFDPDLARRFLAAVVANHDIMATLVSEEPPAIEAELAPEPGEAAMTPNDDLSRATA